jgi:REP element-mobilizing transposase RayT
MKIRKGTQLCLLNRKRAGRPAKNDPGIRHRSRMKINKPTSFHLTIKVRENKADIQSKKLLKALHHAIGRARLKNLKVVHYTLEYNHVHLLVETNDHRILHAGMQALGISFSKAINKLKSYKGSVYKHRYHQRRIGSARELKNVLLYIFNNGRKHKRTTRRIDPFNSLLVEPRLNFLFPLEAKLIWADMKANLALRSYQRLLSGVLDPGSVFFKALEFL